MSKGPDYNTVEEQIIREHYPTKGSLGCQWAGIDRSRVSINHHANKMGVRYLGSAKWKGKLYRWSELAKEFGINRQTLWSRVMERNWTMERALTTPIKVQHHAKK